MNRAEWIEFLKELSRDLGGDNKAEAFDRLKEKATAITFGWMERLYPELKAQYEGAIPEEKKELSEKALLMYDKVVNQSQFGEYTEGLLEVLGLLVNEDLVTKYREVKQQNRNRDYLELAHGLVIVPLEPAMNHNYELNRPVLVIDSNFSQNKGYRLEYDRGTVGDREIGRVKGIGNHLPVIRTALRPAFPSEINEYFEALKAEVTPENVMEIVGLLGG